MTEPSTSTQPGEATLQRRLTLPLLVLYGLGVTVGAGIYVLIGVTAAKAGVYAPISFLLAACVVSFTGFTYSELSTRYPVSAGEAAYVRHGLRSKHLSLVVGFLVTASGIVSAAAISVGAASYLGGLVTLSPFILTAMIVGIIGVIAAWGILESVMIAAVLTLIELAGLALVLIFGFLLRPDLMSDLGQLIPPFELDAWTGIASAGLLAFFAFVGFEDLANVAEEADNPRRNMPLAILLTLIIATLIYLAVVSVVVLAVPMNELVGSASPLALVFSEAHPSMRAAFSVVAAIATLNGALIQMIMSSRVVYGLAAQGHLHKRLATIDPRTHTPLIATALVALIVLMFALFLPIDQLAKITSQLALIVFSFVNLALILLKRGKPPPGPLVFTIPLWVPIVGLGSCIALFLSGFL